MPPIFTIFSASTLGIHISYANAFSDYEIIPISMIDAPLALIPIYSTKIQRDLWVSVSFDHVCTFTIGNGYKKLLDIYFLDWDRTRRT
jgi:hypothetical protein